MSSKPTFKVLLVITVIFYIYTQTAFAVKAWNVTFDTTRYNFSAYVVELIRTTNPGNDCSGYNGTTIWKQTVKDSKPSIVVVIPRAKLKARLDYTVFCIRVLPVELDQSGNESLEDKVIFHEIIRSRQDKCTNLTKNVSLELRMDTERKIIEGVFRAQLCECLREIKDVMYSFYARQNNSDKKDCTDPDHLIEVKEDKLQGSVQNCKIVSEALSVKPGNYCVTLLFYHKECNQGACYYASKIRTLHDTLQEARVSLSSGGSKSWYSLIVIPFVSVGIILLILYCKKLKREIRGRHFSELEGCDVTKMIKTMEEVAKRIELVVLYFHDCEEHDQAVETLGIFFRDTWNIGKVRLDIDNHAKMSILGPSYMARMTKTKPNRRIIIVESNGAIQQEEDRQNLQESCYGSEEFFNEMFQYGLELLKTDCRSLSDYKNLFVVRFGYTSPELSLSSFVPNRRFTLPRHLFDLYCSLVDVPQLTFDELQFFRSVMINKWKQSLEQDLIPSLNGAVNKKSI